MESEKMCLLGRWLPFDKFHSFFRQFSFSKGEILKKSWTLQWLVSAYFSFPFQPLHFGGGDVVQIGTSCFFFEVTWYISWINFIAFIMIDHAHHKGTPQGSSTTAPSTDKSRSSNDLFPMSKQCQKDIRNDRIDWTPPPQPRHPSLSFPHTDGSTIPKKNPVTTGGANWLRFFVKTSKTHVDVSTYLRVNIQSVGHPHQVPHEPSRFATKPTRILYNDVELCVQFTSNFYTRSGWFHSPKKSSPTQDEMDQLQQAVYRVL